MAYTLIANTGIQFIKFNLNINVKDNVAEPIVIYEYHDQDTHEVEVTYAAKVPGSDVYTLKDDLINDDIIDSDGIKIGTEDPNPLAFLELSPVDKESDDKSGFYKIGDIEAAIERFEKLWIPVPFFKKLQNGRSRFGPHSWCRMYFEREGTKDKSGYQQLNVVLAFDTTLDSEQQGSYFSPRPMDTEEGENMFKLSDNDDLNLTFFSDDPKYQCGWVKTYLNTIIHDGDLPEYKRYEHVGEYLFLMKYFNGLTRYLFEKKRNIQDKLKNEKIQEKKDRYYFELDEIEKGFKTNTFPEIKLFSNEQVSVDVDLVLDVGNANTCGLLFESPADTSKDFNFNSVCPLIINDLSDPLMQYKKPFSMRLSYAKAQFGEIDNLENETLFKWPSFVRVGKEANRLINLYNIDIDRGSETATSNSSPKRYLWDKKKVSVPWEFVNIPPKKEETLDDNLNIVTLPYQKPERVHVTGLSTQFTSDGSFTLDPSETGSDPYFSRKSLMTFVYVEIFLHAFAQINSHSFREQNDGPLEKPRKIKRITITCPTSIVQQEQIILRQAAKDAIIALQRFADKKYDKLIELSDLEIDIKIVPEPKELAKDLQDVRRGDRLDWIYDEATCNQLVFLYAEISERYLNKAESFFNLYGKRRSDVEDDIQNSLTIASLDIGGGTTDLMIAAYEYIGGQSKAVIKPKPLFWESFALAGDDLLKAIIKEVILEGVPKTIEDKKNSGVIKNFAEDSGCVNVVEKMQHFFGTDTNLQSYKTRIYRKNFIVQIAVPIAQKFLEHAASGDEDRDITYDEIFNTVQPNDDLVSYLNRHFNQGGASNFDFKKIVWRLSYEKVAQLIDHTYDNLFKQISMIIDALSADFFLISGKPTSIKRFREIFIKYYPVSPDRIISLDKYRVGRWYPNFGEEPDKGDLGYFKDPKTIVAVGATIALMAGKLDKFSTFRLDTEFLIKNLLPTTNYMGSLDTYTQDIEIVYITPDDNKNEVEISGLPVVIGYKQLPSDAYPGRPIYKLEFNDDYFRTKVKDTDNESKIVDQIEEAKFKIKMKMPLRIRFERNINETKETIEIASIKDKTREDYSEKMLKLSLMTLPDENGFWLDTGEFVLNIK